jgi:hypothetical protein
MARTKHHEKHHLARSCLPDGLGAVIAIKIGARMPEGADVDKAKVGAAPGQGTPIRAKNFWV